MGAIVTHGLWKRFQSLRGSAVALKGLDLEVGTGEIFGYLGPNGAGKTTTLKLLMGLVHPSGGHAQLFGRSTDDVEARKDVGFMPEQPSFPRHMSCAELLEICGRLSGLGRMESKRRAQALLDRTGLGNVARKRVRQLSKGMLQWLGLAQALMGDPRLLILDEPMSGLDPIGRRQMRDLIVELRAGGTTVFFSSHILADVEMICDRVGILLGGELVECGRLDEILDRRSEGVEVRARDLPDGVAGRIRTLGGSTRTFGNETLIEMHGSQHVKVILKWILEAGGQLRSLVPRRESLEEYFLRQVAAATRGVSGRELLERESLPADPPREDERERVKETLRAGCS